MAENQNRTLQDKFMLRLPDGMRDQIKAAAAFNGRSTNAEIIARLEQSFAAEKALDQTMTRIEGELDSHRARMEQLETIYKEVAGILSERGILQLPDSKD